MTGRRRCGIRSGALLCVVQNTSYPMATATPSLKTAGRVGHRVMICKYMPVCSALCLTLRRHAIQLFVVAKRPTFPAGSDGGSSSDVCSSNSGLIQVWVYLTRIRATRLGRGRAARHRPHNMTAPSSALAYSMHTLGRIEQHDGRFFHFQQSIHVFRKKD
jgi:hypothetical protein